ncbi:MAG: PQQ-binding-like beta-propeller repeat protein [Pseudomonadales bacterium]|nr:PQQ-binding-like beta-propeller repeat protein [Pseudomonadales bacterium]
MEQNLLLLNSVYRKYKVLTPFFFDFFWRNFIIKLSLITHHYFNSKRHQARRLFVFLIASLIVSEGTLATDGGNVDDAATNVAPEWQAYGGDVSYSRFSSATQITPENVKGLELAWDIRIAGEDEKTSLLRAFANTPLMIDDSLFACTPDEDIMALNPETGETKWRFDFSTLGREHSSIRGNCWGIVYHDNPNAKAGAHCKTRLLHVSQMGDLFAIDAQNGKICESFGTKGIVNFRAKDEEMFDGEIYNVTVPVIIDNTIVVGNSPMDGLRIDGPKGYIRAFDVLSGKALWKFRPIPGPEDKEAYATWAPGSAEKTGAGNVWSGFSADPELGLIYAPVATVAPDYYGGERVGDNLYANSLVALDAKTGKRVWHFQLVHHDVWDYDLPTPPLLVDLTIDGEIRKAAIQLTKMGMIYTFDRETGEPIHEIIERAVPQKALAGEVMAKTQPFPVAPPPLIPHTLDLRNLYGLTPQHKKECEALVEGMPDPQIYAPYNANGIVQIPGAGGGFSWGGATFDSERGILVAPVMNFPIILHLDKKYSLKWLGGIFSELFSFRRPNLIPLMGTPYGLRAQFFAAKDGTPCTPPPWSKLVALDMSKGTILWETPLLTEAAKGENDNRQQMTLGGAISTSAGVTFIAATPDQKFRAFETATGKLLWEYKLPATGNATPMTYEVNGKQYVIIAAGGSDLVGSEPSDHLMAFRLNL